VTDNATMLFSTKLFDAQLLGMLVTLLVIFLQQLVVAVWQYSIVAIIFTHRCNVYVNPSCTQYQLAL
jgi:hypothetical protein